MGPAEMGPERKGEKLSGKIFVILIVKIGQNRSISDKIGQTRTTFVSQKLSAITFVNSSRFFAISLRPHLGRPHLALPNKRRALQETSPGYVERTGGLGCIPPRFHTVNQVSIS